MARKSLTNEQRDAVCARSNRSFIEAAPGAGKTTVAAERFGVLRFTGSPAPRSRVAGISFTRAATGELAGRVRGRWGPTALAWPSRVSTIDQLVYAVLQYLLRRGLIRWPGDHTSLRVLDTWRGHKGYRWLPGGYRRRAIVDGNGQVTSIGVRLSGQDYGIGSKDDFEALLSAGLCTHDVIRDVLKSALQFGPLRDAVTELFVKTIAHLVVDEVFDANRLDLHLVEMMCVAGVGITLIGDPWQALYEFRGASPNLVPLLLDEYDFAPLPLSHSFRFQTPEWRATCERLRAGGSVTVGPGSDYDVVLSPTWNQLWDGPDHVLPLSFGQTANKTGAALVLLLDHLVSAQFNQRAAFQPEALELLGLDRDAYRANVGLALQPVVAALRTGGTAGPRLALTALREAVKVLGAKRRPPSSSTDEQQIERLSWLSARMRTDRLLIPGMTIHQAKGREWDRVGLILNDTQLARLDAGLDRERDSDRALYVAVTRARYNACLA